MIKWNISDLEAIKKNKKTVFSCFSGGGGSSLGYKKAGYEVLGNVELDKEMNDAYIQNLKPKFNFNLDIREFNKIPNKNLPKELFSLDILDGSPPCSSFSMCGNREKDWGKEKIFREGQKKQNLDFLFFEFIETIQKLKPKVFVAENVKGMTIGKAKGYLKEIFREIDKAGYDVQLVLLNSATMGIPQKRERIFFIGRKKSLNWNNLELKFKEKKVTIKEALENVDVIDEEKHWLTENAKQYWFKLKPGQSFSVVKNGSWFNRTKADPYSQCATITTKKSSLSRWDEPRWLTSNETLRLQTFPDDYKAKKTLKYYIAGMSVPPIMMEKISQVIYNSWLKNEVII